MFIIFISLFSLFILLHTVENDKAGTSECDKREYEGHCGRTGRCRTYKYSVRDMPG
jgi:hypothetical protein